MSTRISTTARTRRAALATLALSGVFGATHVDAQEPVASSRSGGFELRPYAGAYVPTGDQRDQLEDALFVGAQASWRIIPQFALTSSFGWAPSKDRVISGDQTLDLFQYDVGGEGRAPSWYSEDSWGFTPFLGLGIGGRTYSYRDLDNVDATTNVAGYGALGGEFDFKRVGLRFEARDYISRFEPPTGNGKTTTRNDVTLAAGLTFRF